ncbi:MAG: hypothetical protein QNJ38_02275 [Prochloraceae cyanobacterium]|nr:hypothetical protein [Prochloraceae cyanobacterium]
MISWLMLNGFSDRAFLMAAAKSSPDACGGAFIDVASSVTRSSFLASGSNS